MTPCNQSFISLSNKIWILNAFEWNRNANLLYVRASKFSSKLSEYQILLHCQESSNPDLCSGSHVCVCWQSHIRVHCKQQWKARISLHLHLQITTRIFREIPLAPSHKHNFFFTFGSTLCMLSFCFMPYTVLHH